MRVAVVDLGSNSTRLLIAEVHDDGSVTELKRATNVTRLGQDVDSSGRLAQEAMDRVTKVLDEYRQAMDELEPERNLAVLTSAVRDAANGQEFTDLVRDRYGLDAKTLTGDQEAQLTFLGATSDRREADQQAKTAVIDIGGGSTEFIVGTGHEATFHVSTQAGVVRMTERHIDSDPPEPQELQSLADDVRSVFAENVPESERSVDQAIAVAGTATSAAAIDQELDPYDPEKVHGYTLALGTVEMLLARLADMTNDERRRVAGLHPDRAPTIVAGMIHLIEAMRILGRESVEVSEHDILRGGALRLAGRG